MIRCQERPVDMLEERTIPLATHDARVIYDQIVLLGKYRSDGGVVDLSVR